MEHLYQREALSDCLSKVYLIRQSNTNPPFTKILLKVCQKKKRENEQMAPVTCIVTKPRLFCNFVSIKCINKGMGLLRHVNICINLQQVSWWSYMSCVSCLQLKWQATEGKVIGFTYRWSVGASVGIFLTLAANLKVDLYSNAITSSILDVAAALIFNFGCGICFDFIREPFPLTLSSSCPPFWPCLSYRGNC